MTIKRRRMEPSDEWENMFQEMERMMNEFFNTSLEDFEEVRKPIVYGFSMSVGPDGKKKLQEFGNAKNLLTRESDEREPLVDIIDEKNEVTVIAEVPGVNKEDIEIKAAPESLSIRVSGGRKYFKDIELPEKIIPESTRAQCKNGVLEIKLKKVKEKRMGKRIAVD